jgi:ABC-type nitrate/sulfonate/bicarbonate transport system ATPase subunit
MGDILHLLGREGTMNSHLLDLCASTAEPVLIDKNQTGSSEQKRKPPETILIIPQKFLLKPWPISP